MNNRKLFIAYKTIVISEIVRFTRSWAQTLIAPIIMLSLYFIIFGNLIGARIGEIDNFSYSQYIAPGLIMFAVITNSYTNITATVFLSRLQRHIEELLVSPIPNSIILAGYVTGSVIRGLLTGIGVTLVALLFTHLPIHSIFLTLLTVILASVLFCLAGFANALFAKKFDDIAIVPTFILTPLTYLGGVFYSVSYLSPFWQALSKINPILYIVNLFRYGILGVSDINVVFAFMVMFAFVILLLIFDLYLLKKGVGIRT